MGVAQPLPDAVPPPGVSPPRTLGAPSRPQRWLRRGLDVTGAAVLLVLAAPLLALGGLVVLFFSGWPVLYGHPRVGRAGRPFRCWKLRTMEVHADARLHLDPELARRWRENGYKLPSDPRTTPCGRVLRRLYLDELPQLFNVLGGSMSLVGPRPLVQGELEEYGPGAPELLSLRPGIFGAWNSMGRHRPDYPERARVELEYVRSRTLRGDLGILARSVPVVLRGFPEDV